jgi:hypothetical protein
MAPKPVRAKRAAELRRVRDRRYEQSEKGKARKRRYRKSPKGLAVRKATDHRRCMTQRYREWNKYRNLSLRRAIKLRTNRI